MQFVEAHGARIPQIGLGTMTLKEDVCVQAVKTALQLGYRHLDTAAFYGNEEENGEGLRASGVKREDVFICTKVRENNLLPDNFNQSLDQSLDQSEIALCRSAADPLEQQGHPVQDQRRCAVPGEEGRQGQACRRRQFHHHDAGRGLGGDDASRWFAIRSRCIPSSTRTR